MLLRRLFFSWAKQGLLSTCSVRVSHCRLSGVQASVLAAPGLSSCGSQALEHRLSSGGAWAYLLQGMWDLPRSGIEPKSPLAMTSAFSWQNSISLCPASFHIPRLNLPVTPGVSWLSTFAFQSPIMKRTSFLGVSSKRSCLFNLSSSALLVGA